MLFRSIYGPKSSGKTTLTLHAIAEIQKQGGTAAFIDAEHALDPSYAKRLGVDTENLLVSQPDNGEQALEITETLVRSNAVDLIVVDSVAALIPQAEIDGDMGNSHMGLIKRFVTFLRCRWGFFPQRRRDAWSRRSNRNLTRSEERRVGKECRSRWSPYH